MTSEATMVEVTQWVLALRAAVTRQGMRLSEVSVDLPECVLFIDDPSYSLWSARLILRAEKDCLTFAAIFGKNRIGPEPVNRLNTELLVDALVENRAAFAKAVADSATWSRRQQSEIGSLPEIPGIDPHIITSGPHAGRYHVKLSPGNPLERLTLDQYTGLLRLLTE